MPDYLDSDTVSGSLRGEPTYLVEFAHTVDAQTVAGRSKATARLDYLVNGVLQQRVVEDDFTTLGAAS